MNYLHDLSDVGLGCWAMSLLLLGAWVVLSLQFGLEG